MSQQCVPLHNGSLAVCVVQQVSLQHHFRPANDPNGNNSSNNNSITDSGVLGFEALVSGGLPANNSYVCGCAKEPLRKSEGVRMLLLLLAHIMDSPKRHTPGRIFAIGQSPVNRRRAVGQ